MTTRTRTRRTSQLSLAFEPRRKKSKKKKAGRGPGRPPSGRGLVAHRARPKLSDRHPVHVTYRMAKGVRSLRGFKLWRALWKAFVKVQRKPDEAGFRICQFSVQGNHLHLICEADDERALSQGLRGFATSVSKRFHGLLARKGSAFLGRYYAEQMTCPRQVRNTLCYVLQNARKHGLLRDVRPGRVDPYTSWQYFDGWEKPPVGPARGDGPPPVSAPRSWLLRAGWKKWGAIGLEERPGGRPRAGVG